MFTEIKATIALYPGGGAQSSNIPYRSNLSETLKLEISEFNNGKKKRFLSKFYYKNNFYVGLLEKYKIHLFL